MNQTHMTFDMMASTFAEEFLRMGFSPEGVLALFQSPTYSGPHSVYLLRGEEWVHALIQRIASREENAHA